MSDDTGDEPGPPLGRRSLRMLQVLLVLTALVVVAFGTQAVVGLFG